MLAEVAILNGTTADTLQNRAFGDFDWSGYALQKEELAQDWLALKSLLDANTSRVVEVIRALPDEALTVEVQMPWGAMTLTQLASYPYWNARYHEGQINFIASLLGRLK